MGKFKNSAFKRGLVTALVLTLGMSPFFSQAAPNVFEVKPQAQSTFMVPFTAPRDVNIRWSGQGNVEIFAVDRDEAVLELTNAGTTPIELKTDMAYGTFSVNLQSVIPEDVPIRRKRKKPRADAEEAVSEIKGPTRVRIGIPRNKLLHLWVRTKNGNIFSETPFMTNVQERSISFVAERGTVQARHLVAKSMLFEARYGDVQVLGLSCTTNPRAGQNPNLTLSVDMGDIVAEDNRASLFAHVRDRGDITIRGHEGVVLARTPQGSIDVDNPNATFEDARNRVHLFKTGCRPFLLTHG